MMQKVKDYGLFFVVLLLFLANIFLFQLDLQYSRRGFIFAMLDVGQGDGLFIESPTGTQILIDGGMPGKVARPLARIMPPFDRKLDAVIITHPDSDHIGGLSEVFDFYEIDYVFESGVITNSQVYRNLKLKMEGKNIKNILAQRGMRLHLGGGAVIDILFPDRDVFDWPPNEASVVSKFSYGDISILLTGDIGENTEKIILSTHSSEALRSDVLKVGHHGSKTSSTPDFVKTVAPTYALISAGKDNKFGHPHDSILESLALLGAKIFRTDLLGTIIMKSDGKNIEFSFKK